MARKAHGLHATQVNTSNYPDDGTSPVGSNEWNENHDPEGMLGFTPATANSSTIIVASGVATITDSVTVIAGEGATTDTLQKLALTNTSQYDLVYLFAASSGYNITLENGDLNADGEIRTVSLADETLSTTRPTILMRVGNYWYGYGGSLSTQYPTNITVADESSDTTCFPLFVTAATGDLAPKTGTNLAFNSSTGVLTATGFAGPITGAVTGNADTATLATTVTITDNESTNESNALIFTAGGDVDGGNLGLESDGNCTYNPSTGSITATGFIGALTGNASGTAATVTGGTQSSITTCANLVESGALNAGSITSGFGTINNGSSTITTTGAVSTGALTVTSLDAYGGDIDNIQNLIHDLSTSGTDIDFNEDQLQTISISANTTFTTANRAIGASKTIRIITDGTQRTLTFPSWNFVGAAAPSAQAASKDAILTLTCFGTADTDIVAAYAVEE